VCCTRFISWKEGWGGEEANGGSEYDNVGNNCEKEGGNCEDSEVEPNDRYGGNTEIDESEQSSDFSEEIN
jgi:hypothetical protein